MDNINNIDNIDNIDNTHDIDNNDVIHKGVDLSVIKKAFRCI